jgi:hypothetical protein
LKVAGDMVLPCSTAKNAAQEPTTKVWTLPLILTVHRYQSKNCGCQKCHIVKRLCTSKGDYK